MENINDTETSGYCKDSQGPETKSLLQEDDLKELSDIGINETSRLKSNSGHNQSNGSALIENGVHHESIEKQNENIKNSGPDGGWGWIVVAGASIVLMSVDTIGQCFGIIFSTFLLEKGASSLMTAWMINMFTFFFCIMALPLAPLIEHFGWRKIAFIGAILLSTATVSSAFATQVWILYFTYSLLAGVGCGTLLTVSYTIVPHYFTRRRGLANGIIMALDSSGQIVAPPLVKWLQDEYAYRGATLILGGIILNCCVAAAVFHPVEWHWRSRNRNKNRIADTDANESAGLEAPRQNQFLISIVNNIKILKSPRAIVIAFGATLFLCGYQNFMAFMPFVVQDAGYSLGSAARCVSLSAVFNMITRLTVASLTDYSWFSYRLSLMCSCTALTATLIAFSMVRDLTSMMVLMCIYGFGVGSYMCLFNLVMVHYFGIDKLMSMMAATMLVTSLSNLTIGPMAGLVRDLTGSYSMCIWVLASMSFCSFILWLLMPLAIRYDQRNTETQER